MSRNFATIIKKGKSRDFIKCMNASVPDKDFWDDCKKVSTIDNEEIKELREIYFVYEMKVDKNSTKKEPTVGKDIIEEARKVLLKYKVK